jgi:hypothetical protein
VHTISNEIDGKMEEIIGSQAEYKQAAAKGPCPSIYLIFTSLNAFKAVQIHT